VVQHSGPGKNRNDTYIYNALCHPTNAFILIILLTTMSKLPLDFNVSQATAVELEQLPEKVLNAIMHILVLSRGNKNKNKTVMAALIYRHRLSGGASSVGFNIRVNNFLDKEGSKLKKGISSTGIQSNLRRFFG
jgi:hypothetical protein